MSRWSRQPPGGVLAALCCAGNATIVASLGAVGLGFLRRDARLRPLMADFLFLAVRGLWQAPSCARSSSTCVVGSLGAATIAVGVLVMRGAAARLSITGGSVGLLLAVLLSGWPCRRANAVAA